MEMPFRQPYRKPSRQQSRKMSTDPHNEINPHQEHFIGIDVGTGSARACIIDSKGDIVGLASENIGLWQPEQDFYEQSTNDIWRCICVCVQRALSQHGVEPDTVRGIGFDATCSLTLFSNDTDEPVSVTGPNFDSDRNVILWLDHRPIEETKKINATKHNLLRYVGGTMSIEMEMPKVLWLKNHMPKELFDRCKFFDLGDALTHIATGNETRSFCSTVCKQGYVPVGVDGSVKGWQEDFYNEIGLGELTEDNFKRMGGVDGVNGKYLSAGDLVGTLSEKAARELGLPAGIAVGSGVIDAYAGWIGTVGAKVKLSSHELAADVPKNDVSQAFGRLAAVAGTSTCHIAMSHDPVFVNGVWGPYKDVLIPDYWMAEGGQSATGELLKYVIETHPAFAQAMSVSETYNTNIYNYLNEHLREMQAKIDAPSVSYLGRHYFFYGDLFGNRSPIADPSMRGAVIGMSNDRSLDGLALNYYGVLEFIALQTRHIVEAMNDAGHTLNSIFMSGSQCQNDILMDLVATACNMPVVIPRYVHAAVCHGAAMLGAKAASADKNGKTEELWSIMDRMSKPGKVIHPSKDPYLTKLLDAKFKVFLDQCQTQRKLRKEIDEILVGTTVVLFITCAFPQCSPRARTESGATNTTPSAPQTGSLFGNSTASQPPQQSSLLSGFGAGAKPQQPSGGLFSGLGTQNQQPQQQQQQQQQQPSGGLFGASTAANTQPTAQPSLFSNTQQGTTAARPPGGSLLGSGTQTQTSLPQLQQDQVLQTSQPAYFESLLEKGRKRNHGARGESAFNELPSLQLGLGDIARRVREMGGSKEAAPRATATDSKAHYLLAASGVSPASAIRDLNTLQAQAHAPAAVQPSTQFDTDIEGYLNKLQTQSTLSMIAESLNRSARDFDSFLEENVSMEWDAQRRRIYEHFGLAPKLDASLKDDSPAFGASSPVAKGGFGRSTRRGKAQAAQGSRFGTSTGGNVFNASNMRTSVIGAPSHVSQAKAPLFADVAEQNGNAAPTAGDTRFRVEEEELFAKKVQQLNTSRLQERVFPVLLEFQGVESQYGGDASQQLAEAYGALIEIVNEDPNAESVSEPNAIKERQFAVDYLDEMPNSSKAMSTRKRIIDGSRRFLEKQFYQNLEAQIARNPREASLGGIPTTLNKVRAFIRLRASRKDLVQDNGDLQMLGDDYCWVLIFYLLRAGLVKEAAEYVTSNGAAFRNIDRNFVTYITSYANSPDRRLPRALQDRINSEYSQRSRIAPEHSIDPYRMACYKVVGRCELSKRSLEGVGQGVEDWIWLQFNLAREVNRVEEVATEVYGLEEVRAVIRDIGQRHFLKGSDNGAGYGIFFRLQILGGMFEQAIAYLYPHSYVAAVHFAIALAFYGLLRVSDFMSSESELLSFNTKGLPQINFGRMLGYYTRDFRAGNVEAAADYLTLICLNADLPGPAGKSQSSLCHEALRELVLETREFAKLLGDIRKDGQRIKGAIEQRVKLIKLADQEEFLKAVTVQAAAVADDNGRTTDAVLLYHLAEEYDNVVQIINRALSEAIAVDLDQEPVRLQPLKPRNNITGASTNGSSNISEKNAAASDAGISFSLTTIEDPVVLALRMVNLYDSNAMYFKKIHKANRQAAALLLQMDHAKNLVRERKWALALDQISILSILPVTARSSVPLIRSAAQAFNSLPPVVAQLIGNLLMWTILCCGRHREILLSSEYEDRTRREMAESLLVTVKDLMVFAGLIRYKLPPRVFEALAHASQDLGA
ncbi:Pentulose kinase [Xylona heveae TC161]|uniref:Pentulose kinase n=1 Tax=Xylona heveae (strain CBS 132557 / TC161) TaxID=1328760 RepID=A0A165GX42_XYLHT|nr:Pentulose kinase [Xylona heveae TC161]KZF22711.1 Pentulose kinase [Xylona heveae TC161]